MPLSPHARAGRTARAARSRRSRAAVLALGAVLVAGAAAAVPTASAAPRTAPAPGGDLWTPASTDAARRSLDAASARAGRVEPEAFRAYRLDAGALQALLARAPQEGSAAAAASPAVVSVPAPDGTLVDFAVVDSPVMADALAADHPEIRTYAGRGVDDPRASIRLDVTPMGFHAAVRGAGGTSAWYVDPALNDASAGAERVYLSYRGSALPADEKSLVEPELGAAAERRLSATARADARAAAREGAPTAGEEPGGAVQQRTYRLALVSDPSYSTYFGAENVLAEKVTLINRVNQIYNDDLAIRLELVEGTERLAFDTLAEATEPGGPCGPVACYTAAQLTRGCSPSLLYRQRVALGQILGASAYDVGHVVLGIDGGGIAGLGVVGGFGKAWGCTGLPQPEGDFMAIDYVAHELGHQFGGPHTFDGDQGACGGFNRTAATSVEPGSGSSVMAYAGICGRDDLQPHTDPYFSQQTIDDVTRTVTAERRALPETQSVALAGYDTDGASYRLSLQGRTTRPIVRGRNDDADGVEAALAAALAPSTVRVSQPAGGGRTTDRGYLVSFVEGPLARRDLPLMEVVAASDGVSSLVSETEQGGPQRNAGTVTTVANRAPVVEAPGSRTIPARTPFALRGSATDPDGDPLVYLWEQDDRGGRLGTSLVAQAKTDGPLFRVFGRAAEVTPAGTLQYDSPGENQASDSATRVFPDIAQVLAGNTNAETGRCPAVGPRQEVGPLARECFSEWLPTADYTGSLAGGNSTPPTLRFRLTARDLAPDGGGSAHADVTLTVEPSAGPFLVGYGNREGDAAVVGRTETLTWQVARTRRLAPLVTISLSTDGGRTYPTVLARNVPNDGAQDVTWPDLPTTQGRIKIQAVDNYFFDLNDADLTLVRPDR